MAVHNYLTLADTLRDKIFNNGIYAVTFARTIKEEFDVSWAQPKHYKFLRRNLSLANRILRDDNMQFIFVTKKYFDLKTEPSDDVTIYQCLAIWKPAFGIRRLWRPGVYKDRFALMWLDYNQRGATGKTEANVVRVLIGLRTGNLKLKDARAEFKKLMAFTVPPSFEADYKRLTGSSGGSLTE